MSINWRGISVNFHFKNGGGHFYKFSIKKLEGHFYKFQSQKLEWHFRNYAQNRKSPEKFIKNSRKILEKSLNLEIEYLKKYNSCFHEIFSVGSRI